MSVSRAFHRPWAFLTALVLAGSLAAGVSVLRAMGLLPETTRTEQRGKFEITYRTYDAFGHRGTERTLHYHRPGRRLLVTRDVVAFITSPHNPDRVLYEYCPGFDQPECGIHYFDGKRARSWRVGGGQTLSAPISWSADGRLVVLAEQHHLRIVNLDEARTTDLAPALGLEEGRRFVRFGGWSDDLKEIAVLVGEHMDREPPRFRIAEDLVVIDLSSGAAWYVATALPRGWDARHYSWLKTSRGYSMYALPDGDHVHGKVYRKKAADLPDGLSPLPR